MAISFTLLCLKKHPIYINVNTRHIRLIHYDLVTPYGDRDLGQHWLRHWLVAWRHQAINWTNVDLSSARASGIHLRTFSQEIPQPPITEISLKIIYIKCGMKLIISSQTSTTRPLRSGNGHVILSHTLLRMWLLIYIGIRLSPCICKAAPANIMKVRCDLVKY